MVAGETNHATYQAICAKLDDYLAVRHNIIYEQVRFNRRIQEPGKTAEAFIVAVYSLAAKCNFMGMKNDLIRDRLVVRIWDSALSEWLQLNATLTLDDAVKQIRQQEVVHKHPEIQQEDSKHNPIVMDACAVREKHTRIDCNLQGNEALLP